MAARLTAATRASARWDPAASPLGFLAWAGAFTVSYTLLPVFAENQHTKCLAGLARAGFGRLAEDWLARCTDPFPLFTVLVEWTYRLTGAAGFYAWPVLLFGAYLAGCSLLARALLGEERAAAIRLPFLATVVVTHSALLSLVAEATSGLDLGWALQSGIASQYLLGPVFQPAMFGALLLVGVGLAGVGRPYAAVAALTAATLVHPAYLWPAVLLGFGVALAERRERPRVAVAVAALTVLVGAVVGAAGALRFAPSSDAAWQLAVDTQLYLRMPHHTLPQVFFNPDEAIKLLWALAGVAATLAARRVAAPVLVLAGAAAAASAAAAATGSDALELAQPWRASAVLVPLATVALAARALEWIARRRGARTPLRLLAAGALLVTVLGGVVLERRLVAKRAADPASGLFHWVGANLAAGDLYLVPVTIPAPRCALPARLAPEVREALRWRGAASDLAAFRLATGAPALVTFKSNPIRDVEVGEWLRRLTLAARFYDPGAPARAAALDEIIARFGVTHVVAPADGAPLPSGVEVVYRDAAFVVGRVDRPRVGTGSAATAR